MTALTVMRDDGPLVGGVAHLVNRRFSRTAPTVVIAAGLLLIAFGQLQPLGVLTVEVAVFVLLVGTFVGNATSSRWAWLVPAVVRGVELGVIIRIAQVYPEPLDVQAYAFVAVVAIHYYDIVYRLRATGEAPPTWVRISAGGWDGRLVAVCAFSLTPALPTAMSIAAATLAVFYLIEIVLFWSARSRPASAP